MSEYNDELSNKAQPLTASEKIVMLELIGRNKDLVECKATASGSKVDKTALWKKIATSFSSQPFCSKKTGKQAKAWWENSKKRAKSKVMEQKKEIRKTGGGKMPPPLPLETLQVAALIPAQMDSLEMDFDCDVDEIYLPRINLGVDSSTVQQETVLAPLVDLNIVQNSPEENNKKGKGRDPRSTLLDFEYEEHKVRLKILNTEYETALLKKLLLQKQVDFVDKENELKLDFLRSKLLPQIITATLVEKE